MPRYRDEMKTGEDIMLFILHEISVAALAGGRLQSVELSLEDYLTFKKFAWDRCLIPGTGRDPRFKFKFLFNGVEIFPPREDL